MKRSMIWFDIGALVVHKARPKNIGKVEAVWTDHKLAQEFVQVLWENGAREILPVDQLESYVDYTGLVWKPEPSPRKEFIIRRKVPREEVDMLYIRAALEKLGYNETEIQNYSKILNKANIYETLEGWLLFETNEGQYLLKSNSFEKIGEN